MKHFGSRVLGEGLKHNRSKTEPRTRTRTYNLTAALVVTERRREPVDNPLASARFRAMRCEVSS